METEMSSKLTAERPSMWPACVAFASSTRALAPLGGTTSLPEESFELLNPWLPEPPGLIPPLPPGLFGKGGTPPSFKTVRVAPDEGIAIPPLPAAVANDVPVFFGFGRRPA